MMNAMRSRWIARAVVFGLAALALTTLFTMLLWNNLAVPVLQLPTLTFFQTLGLMVLGRLLTGGFGPRSWRRGFSGRGHWMRQKWHSMRPEEREQFMQRWGNRPGCGPMYRKENAPETPANPENA